jgi:hypothetical protein
VSYEHGFDTPDIPLIGVPRPAWDAMVEVVEQAWSLVRRLAEGEESAPQVPAIASRLRVALADYELKLGMNEREELSELDAMLRTIELGGGVEG